MPTERPPLLGEVVPTFAERGCCVVSATNPPGRILRFLDRPHAEKHIKFRDANSRLIFSALSTAGPAAGPLIAIMYLSYEHSLQNVTWMAPPSWHAYRPRHNLSSEAGMNDVALTCIMNAVECWLGQLSGVSAQICLLKRSSNQNYSAIPHFRPLRVIIQFQPLVLLNLSIYAV
jgi:hypothetical protein